MGDRFEADARTGMIFCPLWFRMFVFVLDDAKSFRLLVGDWWDFSFGGGIGWAGEMKKPPGFLRVSLSGQSRA